MSKRKELDSKLRAILPNVYYQPPSTIKMQYPCVVYSRNRTNPFFADNQKYVRRETYQVTVVDENPDSNYANAVDQMVEARWVNSFSTQGLHHFVFEIYI